jgi:hypothetical protein
MNGGAPSVNPVGLLWFRDFVNGVERGATSSVPV